MSKEQGMDMREHDVLCVGIDLGTTNSVLATINVKPNGDLVSRVESVPRTHDICAGVGGKAVLSSKRESTLPSCVYYREENSFEPLVGGFAKHQYTLRPHLVAKSVKSQMGSSRVTGLAEDVPDKTPAQVSSRILKHLLKETAAIYRRKEITDAVITVPANFDPVMCKATLDAASLAGIKVTNDDGSSRPVLLSEPNAVIYDFMNQSQNGEISSDILDLSTKKNVLVFDLGGGTLDITMHEICRRGIGNGVLKIKDLATNRYTLLGGDDFDEAIANVMYQRYLKQYEDAPSAHAKLVKEKEVIMAQLRSYAESLKISLNERCGTTYTSGWDDEEDEIRLDVGGGMGGIGYAYGDSFTKEEVEEILSPFMAEHLKFSDFRRISEIKETRNIIYPVLDVLEKTLQKLKAEDNTTEEVTVDAVIVNGGMSKFYMIRERLTRFFGFEPIVVLDPDLAVARGAAVYHYYLHKYQVLQDDMRLVDLSAQSIPEHNNSMEIQWGSSILNDSLYLGVRNNGVQQIIPTGAELPYRSEVMTGFSIEPGQNMICIPIKSRNLDGTYRTIASGKITFSQKYPAGAYVAFQISMGNNKVITMKAWTSKDEQGQVKLEEGVAEIAIGQMDNNKKYRINAPGGSELNPANELHNLANLCMNHEAARAEKKIELAKRISQRVKLICAAGNKAAFAEPLLEELGNASCEELRHRLFTIARTLGTGWTPAQLKKLAARCMDQISGELMGLASSGLKVSTNIQAILALTVCGNPEQLKRLEKLYGNSRYLQACLYVHGRTGTGMEWLHSEFNKAVAAALKSQGNHLQFSAYAMSHAVKASGALEHNVSLCEDVTGKLVKCIQSGCLTNEALVSAILALGWICDQRTTVSPMKPALLKEASQVTENLGTYYDVLAVMKCEKAAAVAHKLIQGTDLNQEEEEFLLTKLEM